MRTVYFIFFFLIVGSSYSQAQIDSVYQSIINRLPVINQSYGTENDNFYYTLSQTRTYKVGEKEYAVHKFVETHCPSGGRFCEHGHLPLRTTMFWCKEFETLCTGTSEFFLPPVVEEESKKPVDLLLKQLIADTKFFNFRR
jgi:hypothetical protein